MATDDPFTYGSSGNVIAKSAKIRGAQHIVNNGRSLIGDCVEIRGDRHEEGKPAVSWDRFVILESQCALIPPRRRGKFYTINLGSFVYVGKNTKVEAVSIGSNVIIGDNCHIGKFAVIKDAVILKSGTTIPPYSVVGPLADENDTPLPESTPEVIEHFCRQTHMGLKAIVPKFQPLY